MRKQRGVNTCEAVARSTTTVLAWQIGWQIAYQTEEDQ